MKKIKLMAFLVLMVIIVGCYHVKRHKETSTEEAQEPILIFVMGSDNRPIVRNLQSCYPELNLEVIEVDATKVYGESKLDITMEEVVDHYIKQYGNPDVIICNPGRLYGNIAKWAENEYVCNLNEFMEMDVNCDKNQYYPGVFDIGKIDGKLYALPLGLKADFWTMRESAWKGSYFSELTENYTKNDLLNALENQLRYENDQGINGKVVVDGLEDGGRILYSRLLQWGAIEYNQDVDLEQSLFEQLWTIQKLADTNVGFHSDHQYLQSYTLQDPLALNEQYLASSWYWASGAQVPSIALLRAQCINRHVFNEATKVVWIPYQMKDGQNEYAVEVAYWGMVGGQSERKEQAYEVLRFMIDMMPTVYYQDPYNLIAHIPVNRQCALAMIDEMDQSEITCFYYVANGNLTSAPGGRLDPELKESIEEYMNHITKIYAVDVELQHDILQILVQYDKDGYLDYSSCYSKVLYFLKGCHEVDKFESKR